MKKRGGVWGNSNAGEESEGFYSVGTSAQYVVQRNLGPWVFFCPSCLLVELILAGR
jgi:hypothetical protein